MIHMERTMVIERPRPEVFDYIADLGHLPAYIGPIDRVIRISTPRLQPGTRLTVEAHFLGIHFSQRAELLEHERPRRLVARSVGGRFRFEAGFELEARGGRSILSGWGRAEAPRLFPLAETIVGFLIERQIDGDLKRLKRTLERSV
ncbi:MAG: hypothetical protein NVSMB17_15770 [Candidatus Dormibacteria bacterium]